MKPYRLPIALAAFVALSFSPLQAQDQPVTLKRTYKKGDVARYKAESDIVTSMGEAKLTGTSRMTVKEVKENGHIVVEEATEEGKLSFNGMDIDIPNMPPTLITRDNTGKLVDLKREDTMVSSESPEIAKLMVTIGAALFPDRAVKPGDSWETEADNPAVKDEKVKIKTNFVGIEKVDGRDVWKLKQTTEAATDKTGGKLKYEALFWLDPSNGQEVQTEVMIRDLPSQFGLLTFKTKARRISAGAKSASS